MDLMIHNAAADNIMNYNQIHRFLEQRGEFKIKLGLEKIQTLLNKIGNPEKELKCIHVAGTNGKGSVCAMLASVLKENGCKTGLYISPHVYDFRERYQINGRYITKKEFESCFSRIKPYITNQSYFEIITALAFLWFKQQKVDFVVLEVGLGGRLDATNMVTPFVSVITNIALEHTEILGKTIEKIAFEKAGIIKNKVPVVTGAQGSALKVIKKIAKQRGCSLYCPDKIVIKNNKLNLNGYKNIKLGLKASYQHENAAVALKVIDILRNKYRINLKNKKILSGLKKAYWLGRFEFIEKNVLIDAAHNPACFEVLKKELQRIKNNYRKIILIFSALNDKDVKKMLDSITPMIDGLIITKIHNQRALSSKIIRKYAKQGIILDDVNKALKYAKKIADKKDLIVVAGSIYLLGEMKR